MTKRIERHGLQVDQVLHDFLEEQALPGTGVAADTFWKALSDLAHDFGPKNSELLRFRDQIQQQIDDWHIRHRNQPHDHEAYKAFLTEIGYLLPEGDAFEIETQNTAPEIASVPARSLSCRSPMRVMR